MEHSKFAFRRTWGPIPKYKRVLEYQRRVAEHDFIVIAGPCSVESPSQIHEIASYVAKDGATHLRGGVFRAGTYPGNNFGLISWETIRAFHAAAKINNLENIIEVLDYRAVDKLEPYAHCFQVGARSMQNYTLLNVLGKTGKPIFLKRHPGATLDEWLGSAEHLLASGSEQVYLIERGSSTNANHVRWDLSISMIPAIKGITDIPIIVDASHGTGRRDLVRPMTLSGVAAGSDGILVEVHTDPDNSLSDADQAITPAEFHMLIDKVESLRKCLAH